jgi:hypothetical protein
MCCPPVALKRVHYFSGHLLSAEDLRAEQAYFLERLRRHNRCCHGWGVVCGLEITVSEKRVVVSPGMALDCEGNEITLSAAANLDLPSGSAPATQYVLAALTLEPVDPVPTIGEPAGPECPLAYSRVLEGCGLTLAADNPGVGHKRRGRHCVSCGTNHGVPLGRLRRTRGRWRLDPQFQTCRVVG